MLCSRCDTDLPDGSQFCLKCGQSIHAAEAESAPPPPALPTPSACSRCGTSLPSTAAFCLKCGQPVISAASDPAFATVPHSSPVLLRTRWQHLIPLSLLLLTLLGVMLWALTSESPAAQQVQEFVRWSHEQTIVDAPVSVNPRSFSSSEVTVPPGALNVSITGEFSTAATSPGPSNSSSNKGGKNGDDGIEALVLTDSAFVVWSSGYTASTLYQSGPAAEATINAPLPVGGGVYRVVFSNKISSRAKAVRATVVLHYTSGLPDAVVRLKDRFWNWVGF